MNKQQTDITYYTLIYVRYLLQHGTLVQVVDAIFLTTRVGTTNNINIPDHILFGERL